MSITLRKAKSILQKARLLDKVELGGRGRDWSIECPNDRIEKQVSKAFAAQGIGLGGYRTGYGAWVLKPDYKSKGDWGDPGSRHHYASEVLAHYGVKTASARSIVVTYQKGREIKIALRQEQLPPQSGTVDEFCKWLKDDKKEIQRDLTQVMSGCRKWIGALWNIHGWTDNPQPSPPVLGEPEVGDKFGDQIVWGTAYWTYHPGRDFDWAAFQNSFRKTAKNLKVYDVKFK